MRKAGKQIFVPLGRLRDSQVMIDWLNKLGSPDDPATKDLSAKLAKEEQELKISASRRWEISIASSGNHG